MKLLLIALISITAIAGPIRMTFYPELTFYEFGGTTNRIWECDDLADTSSWECVYYNVCTGNSHHVHISYRFNNPDGKYFFRQVNDEPLLWVVNTNSANTNGIPVPPGG